MKTAGQGNDQSNRPSATPNPTLRDGDDEVPLPPPDLGGRRPNDRRTLAERMSEKSCLPPAVTLNYDHDELPS